MRERKKYKRPESSKADLLRMCRKLFKQNMELKRKLEVWTKFKKWMQEPD